MAVIDDMRASLREAMKARDREAVSALRTALAAVENAEAPPIDTAGLEVHGSLTQHDRLDLSAAEVTAVLRAQIVEREEAIASLQGRGQDDTIARLTREIAVLVPFTA